MHAAHRIVLGLHTVDVRARHSLCVVRALQLVGGDIVLYALPVALVSLFARLHRDACYEMSIEAAEEHDVALLRPALAVQVARVIQARLLALSLATAT